MQIQRIPYNRNGITKKNPLLNCEINYKRLTIFGLGKIVVVLKSNLLSIAVSLECIEVVLCSKLLKSIRSRFPKTPRKNGKNKTKQNKFTTHTHSKKNNNSNIPPSKLQLVWRGTWNRINSEKKKIQNRKMTLHWVFAWVLVLSSISESLFSFFFGRFCLTLCQIGQQIPSIIQVNCSSFSMLYHGTLPSRFSTLRHIWSCELYKDGRLIIWYI